MDISLIITTAAVVIGILAGIIQILDYFQKRGKKDSKTLPKHTVEPTTKSSSSNNKHEPLHNLPSCGTSEFFGRETEIGRILAMLAPQTSNSYVLINGIAGIGKSALALAIGHHFVDNFTILPVDERFSSVIWISAKPSILTIEGIKERRQGFRTLLDMFSVISITLEREDIIRAKQEQQYELVRKVLKDQRVLLIIDNLEAVDGYEVMEFINELPRPSKAIITTRKKFDSENCITLGELPFDEASSFMHNLKNIKGADISEQAIEELYKKIGGIPLAIEWCFAQLGVGYKLSNVLSHASEPNSDISRYFFENSINSLGNTTSYFILLILGIFPHGASYDALEYISKGYDNRCDFEGGIAKLERLSLIIRREKHIQVLPLTQRYAYIELMSKFDLQRKFIELQSDYYLELMINCFGTDYWGSYFRRSDWGFLDEEYYTIRDVIELSAQREAWKTVLVLSIHLIHFLEARDLWEERLHIGELALKASRIINDYENMAWILGDTLPWIYYQRNEYDRAKISLEECERISREHQLTEPYALSQSFLAELLAKQGIVTEAVNKLRSLSKEDVSPFTKNRILRRLASLLASQNQFDEAEELFLKVITNTREATKTGEESASGISLALRQYGNLLIKAGRLKDAEINYAEALDLEQRAGRISGIASSLLGLAEIQFAKGDYGETERLARKCLADFNRTGMSKQAADCAMLLQKVGTYE